MTGQAYAEAARTIGTALLKLAAELERDAPAPSADVVALELPQARGERQQAILDLPELASEHGMKTSDIARAISYETPNTYTTLQALERANLVEMISGVTPQTWRLAARYRQTGATFARVAARVRPGEWTTYGDISIVVRGDTKAARAVGQAAAKIPDFPAPHRVLLERGRISPDWRSDDGRGPEECERLLRAEGVDFTADGRAEEASRVSWDVLKERDDQEPVPE